MRPPTGALEWGTKRGRIRIHIGCVCTCRGACGRGGGTGIFTSYGSRYESACHARTQHARMHGRSNGEAHGVLGFVLVQFLPGLTDACVVQHSSASSRYAYHVAAAAASSSIIIIIIIIIHLCGPWLPLLPPSGRSPEHAVIGCRGGGTWRPSAEAVWAIASARRAWTEARGRAICSRCGAARRQGPKAVYGRSHYGVGGLVGVLPRA